MSRMRVRIGLASMMAAFAVAAAIAQQAGAPGAAAAPPTVAPTGQASSRSMWSVIADGMEWPAYFILAGSLAVIALITEHFITIRRATIAPAEQVKRTRDLIEGRRFGDCLNNLRNSNTFFARVLTAALGHSRHGFDAMHEAALEKSHELSGRLFRKAEYLNMLGNLGPLMGLLGTVYGMIVAFHELGAGGGEAGAGQLARGISLALVNTLLGLFLAIVGLLFFGICRNRIDGLTVNATVQALDLLEYFRPVASPATISAAAAATAEPRRAPQPAATATAQ